MRTPDAARERLASGAAWDEFCEKLKRVGREILREDLPDADLERAEGYRFLLQRLNASLDELLDASTGEPLVTLYSHKLGKYGMDSADAKYSVARIRGDARYRVFGRFGSAHLVALQLVTSRRGYEAFASIGSEEIPVDAAGNFELLVSPERPASWKGAWLALHPRSTELLFREYFHDWERETPSEFMIERVGGPANPATPGPADVDALLAGVADAFANYVPTWLAHSLHFRTQRINRFDPPAQSAEQGIRDNAYGSAWFRVRPGEALLIELDEPDAHLWSFELGNFWWESLDYVSHTSSLNGFQAVRSSDGRYRLVIALEDPGVPNWLDPVGHPEGMVVYRYQRARGETRTPSTRLLPLAELRGALPSDTPRVDPEARRSQIRMRQRHAARRWAP